MCYAIIEIKLIWPALTFGFGFYLPRRSV